MMRFVAAALLVCAVAAGLAWIAAPFARTGLFLLLSALLPLLVACVPQGWSRRRVLLAGLCVGCALRLLFLPLTPGSDVYRYVWEGFIQSRGINPYLLPPAHPNLAPLAQGALAEVLARVNHPELPAIYGPLAQLVFRLLAHLRPEPFFFKCVFAAIDLLTLAALGWLLNRRALPPARIFYYAAHPLPLLFIAGEGHLDSLMGALLLAGLALVLAGHEGKGFFCIGLAAMVKYLAFFAVPFLLTGRNWKQAAVSLLPLMLFAPYAAAGSQLFGTLALFGGRLHFNDGLTELLRLLAGPAALPLAMLVLLGAWALIFLTVHDRLRAVLLAGGALLLCLPTLHPWYLLLLAPLAALFAAPTWLWLQALLAAAALPATFIAQQGGLFQEIGWHKLLAWLPAIGLLARAAWVNGIARVAPQAPVLSLSVVIPTLNEEEQLGACLAALAPQRDVAQIVIADGGSTDGTCELARRSGAQVANAAAGRGQQIAAGIAACHGEAILVLHADCLPGPELAASILSALNRSPQAVGGAVAMAFNGPQGSPLAWIAVLNNLRARLTGIAFGDQGQFVRRAVLPAIGGFPDQALMEDVELSLRLKEQGRLLLLPVQLSVSGRRWRRQGPMRGVLLVVGLTLRYLFGRRFRADARWVDGLYIRYYGHRRAEVHPCHQIAS